MPERSKGVDSSSTVFALVGSNPTADMLAPLTGTSVSFCAVSARSRVCRGFFAFLFYLLIHSFVTSTHGLCYEVHDTRFTHFCTLLQSLSLLGQQDASNSRTRLQQILNRKCHTVASANQRHQPLLHHCRRSRLLSIAVVTSLPQMTAKSRDCGSKRWYQTVSYEIVTADYAADNAIEDSVSSLWQ